MNIGFDPCVNEISVEVGPEGKAIPEAITIRLQVDPPEAMETAIVEPKEGQHGEDPTPLGYEEAVEDQADEENTLLSPAVVRRRDLGRDPSTSQKWRLSMNGTPEVFGSICEAQVEEEESTSPTATASSLTELDRRDATFRVPLLQSVQLASAMFDNGHRVPLVLYYVAEELRNRASSGNLDLETLFPLDWDIKDDDFEALVTVFDERPFGQGYDLTLTSPHRDSPKDIESDSMGSSKLENLVQSLQMEEESTTQSTQSDASSLAASSPLYSPAISPSEPLSSSSTSQFIDKEDSEESTSVSSGSLSRLILRFLHDLPEALIPSDVLLALSNVVQLERQEDKMKTQTLGLLLRGLAEEQQHLLQFLLELVDNLIRIVGGFDWTTVENSTSEDPSPLPSSSESPHHGSLTASCARRIFKVLGLASTGLDFRAMETQPVKQSSASLYGHYKNCIERRMAQDRVAIESSNTMSVFRYLIQHRVQIFAVQPQELKQQQSGPLDLHNTVEAKSKNYWDDEDLESGYQSESALMERRRRQQRPKDDRWRMRQQHSGRRRRQGNLPPLITSTTFGDQQQTLQKTSTETLCDSAVEIRSQDQLALAVLQEHMARMLRSQRHLPHPSLATMHSIMAERHSDMGDLAVEAPSPRDLAQTQDEEEDEDRLSKARKRRMDFLKEPLDRMQEEREIQLVEKEILQSELTTKFLASNLVGLYPSSSLTPIPAIILPSARNTMLLHPSSANNSTRQEERNAPGARGQSRDLLLAPQEQIVLPKDHVMSDGCTCSYCTTLIQPSKVPVLSKAEYELAELQSQCKSKDLHVTDLLKTVQGLQSQVNILNAKLLFLHDHHTTRPMRRRTLARNSYPTQPGIDSSNHIYSNGGSHHGSVVAQDSDLLQSSGGGHRGARLTSSSITTASSASHASRSPLTFSEGIRLSTDGDARCVPETQLDPGNVDLHMLEDDEAMSFLDLDDGRPPPPVTKQQGHWSLNGDQVSHSGLARHNTTGSIGYGSTSTRIPRYESELERALRDVEEAEEEPEREGEDLLDEFYYKDAYKTMDQQLYRRPVLPMAAPPRPMSADQYKKHHRMSLPIQSLMSKRISLRETFRWKGKPAVA